MRIALVVDNPYRDLPGILLLATRLCEQGATCYLAPVNLEWLEVSALAPDFVLLTNLRGPKQIFARRLLDAGIRIGVLDSEGGVMPNLETYRKMTSPDIELFKHVSCFCSWGPTLANYVGSQGWYRPEQLAVTGAPRFDFYADRWREAAFRASPQVAQYAAPIILVNGSFPRANPAFQTVEQERQSWAALGYDGDYMRRYQRIESDAIRAMATLTNDLAARFPHATVVYRPHPFEKLSTYASLLDRRDNLHLVKLGTVEGWILRANVIIHRNSTTAIEAAMTGRPALLPSWIEVAETLPSVDAVSTPCATQAELEARVAQSLAQGDGTTPPNWAVQQVVHDWFFTIDGSAHERVAAVTLPHANGARDQRARMRACRAMHYQWGPAAKPLASRVSTTVRKSLQLPVTWSFTKWSNWDPSERWMGSDKKFDATRVQALSDAIWGGRSAVAIEPAQAADYRLDYRWGRSVALRPDRSRRVH